MCAIHKKKKQRRKETIITEEMSKSCSSFAAERYNNNRGERPKYYERLFGCLFAPHQPTEPGEKTTRVRKFLQDPVLWLI